MCCDDKRKQDCHTSSTCVNISYLHSCHYFDLHIVQFTQHWIYFLFWYYIKCTLQHFTAFSKQFDSPKWRRINGKKKLVQKSELDKEAAPAVSTAMGEEES